MNKPALTIFTLAALAALSDAAWAGRADVVGAKAFSLGDGLWRFDVSVKHADDGWEHYADNFEILTPQGALLGRRVLLHPHENEQPFTRSLSGVRTPPGVARVRIRAHDKKHGYGGKELILELRK